jgi:Predicted transcriptional regulator
MISYEPFWKSIKEKQISQYKLINTYHISRGLLYRLKNNESVTTHTIDMLCNILSCDVQDIIEYISYTEEEDDETEDSSL